jgi:hypothetical protein
VRSSITSKSSPRGFASAPSADISGKIPKNFYLGLNTCHTIGCGYGCEQHCSHSDANHCLHAQPRPVPNRCTRTTQPRPVSCTTPSAPPAALTSCCPQLAQALILLLKYLRVCSLENGAGDKPFHTPVPSRESAECRCFRLAFKMASDALRLWFDCRFGRRNGLPARASVGGQYRASRGVAPPTLALLFGVMKGRNGRGDDHSRPDRLEVPPGAG